MPTNLRLGRKPAVADDRVPYLHSLRGAAGLPPAPAWANWYAGVGAWRMLGNDSVGDCVLAAIAHATMQFTAYTGEGTERDPTEAEVIAAYSEVTGYDPPDPATDQGTVLLGPGGAMQYWHTKGFAFAGARNKVAAYMQLHPTPGAAWQQAIHFFGGLLLGINLPEAIVAGETVPYLWNNATGPVAGGHEIWLCGYQQVEGETYYDLVSWGQRCRAPAAFLAAVTDEAVCVYDADSISARGLNGDDFEPSQLYAAMAALRASA
jgi:hypothetical protein